jgi:hypothetical protein
MKVANGGANDGSKIQMIIMSIARDICGPGKIFIYKIRNLLPVQL